MKRGRLWAVGILLVLIFSSTLWQNKSQAVISQPSPSCTEYAGNPLLSDSQPYYTKLSGILIVSYATYYDYSTVLRKGGAYFMWVSGFVGNVSGIYRETSPDGVHWSLDSVPALTTGANGTWDSGVVYSPDVLWNGTVYLMYYVGTGTNSFRQIGVAFSPDGVVWTKYSRNPVLVGGPAFYDSWYGRFPSVIDDNGTYKMWYTGHTLTNTTTPWYIAVDYATSPDGLHWKKYPYNPVFGATNSSWTDNYYQHPSVVLLNGTYLMASGGPAGIGLSTSADGIHWIGPQHILISTPKGGWDNSSVGFPSMIVNGSQILLWFTGSYSVPHGMYYSGIGLAECSLLLLSTTRTVTSVSVVTSTRTSISTETMVSTQTTTLTATASELVPTTTGLVALSAATAVIGAFVALALSKARRRESG